MKRVLLALIAFLVVLSLAPVAAQQGATYYVNVRAAKVRAEPKATAKLITTLARATPVVILEVVAGEKVSGVTTWYKVNANGKEGYVLSSLLTDRAPAVATPKPTNNTAASSTGSTANSSPIPAAVQSGGSCPSLSYTCSKLTCAQAYACLAAGNGKLDDVLHNMKVISKSI